MAKLRKIWRRVPQCFKIVDCLFDSCQRLFSTFLKKFALLITWFHFFKLAEVEGFEPSNGGIKIRCLAAWRHPSWTARNAFPLMSFPSKIGRGGRIRTFEWRNQSPLPYRLATPLLTARRGVSRRALNRSFCLVSLQCRLNPWQGRKDSNLRMAESKSAALPLGDAPPDCFLPCFPSCFFFRSLLLVFAACGVRRALRIGGGGEIRTHEWWIQNPLP